MFGSVASWVVHFGFVDDEVSTGNGGSSLANRTAERTPTPERLAWGFRPFHHLVESSPVCAMELARGPKLVAPH